MQMVILPEMARGVKRVFRSRGRYASSSRTSSQLSDFISDSSFVPTVAWISACLRRCRARTFSSTVPSAMSLTLTTVRFCPA